MSEFIGLGVSIIKAIVTYKNKKDNKKLHNLLTELFDAKPIDFSKIILDGFFINSKNTKKIVHEFIDKKITNKCSLLIKKTKDEISDDFLTLQEYLANQKALIIEQPDQKRLLLQQRIRSIKNMSDLEFVKLCKEYQFGELEEDKGISVKKEKDFTEIEEEEEEEGEIEDELEIEEERCEIPTETYELNENNFDRIINSNDLVLIDFYATWCPPCKIQSKIIEEDGCILTEKFSNILLARVDVDKNKNLSRKFRITSVPTLFIYYRGRFNRLNPGLCKIQEIITAIQGVIRRG